MSNITSTFKHKLKKVSITLTASMLACALNSTAVAQIIDYRNIELINVLRNGPTGITLISPEDGFRLADWNGGDVVVKFSAHTGWVRKISGVQFNLVAPDGTLIYTERVCGSAGACQGSTGVNKTVRVPQYKPGMFKINIQVRDTDGNVIGKQSRFEISPPVTYDGFVLRPQSSLMSDHPRLSELPAIHFDHYNSSVTDYQTPSATEELILSSIDVNEVNTRIFGTHSFGRVGLCLNFMSDPQGNLLGFCGDPTGVWGAIGGIDFQLTLFDRHRLDVLDQTTVTNVGGTGNNACGAPDSERAPLNLGYFVMDNEGRVIFPNDNNRIKFFGVTGRGRNARLREVRSINLGQKRLPGMAAGYRLSASRNQVAQILPDFIDGYWFMGTGDASNAAFVGHLNRREEVDFFIWLNRTASRNERIENGMAIDETGVYVLSDHAFYKFAMVGGSGRQIFSHRYERANRCKPGTIAHEGSGSTPTLLGDDLVAFTDNADGRVNVVVLDRRNEPGRANREICRVPVFGDYRSANENSLIGYNNSIIVQNWYNAPSKTNGISPLMVPGIWRIDVAPDRSSCSVVWRNERIGTTATARLSTRTGLIYLPVENWRDEKLELAFLDFETGEEVRDRFKLGDLGSDFNPRFPYDNQILMIPIYVLPGGELVQPVYAGMRKITARRPVRVRVH